MTVHLDALTKKGYIERGKTPRSIGVICNSKGSPTSAETKAPLLRNVRAGVPILAEEHMVIGLIRGY